jgi:CRISPR type III-A-associated RAMP protein Csm4
MPALLVQLEPRGAWRNGPATGERERVDPILHSDTLHSALCHAFAALGWIDEWLAAQVRLTSLFPWQGDDLYITPPRHLWPPPVTKLRAHGASFVPLRVVAQILEGAPLKEDQWRVDGLSRCLHARHFRTGPFRIALRSRAGVDRLTGASVDVHRTACLEFSDNAGLWCAAEFDDAVWEPRLRAAFGWLADSGLGGERTSGWGHSVAPKFRSGELAELLRLPLAEDAGPRVWWLLSLLAPGGGDSIDWNQGDYGVVRRGRLGSEAEAMVTEGSVLLAGAAPVGKTWSPEPGIHRSGLALTFPVALARSAS